MYNLTSLLILSWFFCKLICIKSIDILPILYYCRVVMVYSHFLPLNSNTLNEVVSSPLWKEFHSAQFHALLLLPLVAAAEHQLLI